MNDKAESNGILWHQSGVNRAGEPFVRLMHGGEVIGQMTPREAREHAQGAIEAAEAAEQDAFLLDFAKNKIECDETAAVGLLTEFRKYRESRNHKQER
jgi:hypothetical protein